MTFPIQVRPAARGMDAYNIIKSYQMTFQNNARDPIFSDLSKLEDTLNTDEQIWMVAELNNTFVGFLCVLFDKTQNLAKLSHLRTTLDGTPESLLNSTQKMIAGFLAYAATEKNWNVEVMYVTSSALATIQLENLAAIGFVPIGVFPGNIARDNSGLNGICAHFKEGVLETGRYTQRSLHPAIAPFYNALPKELQLPAIKVTGQSRIAAASNDANYGLLEMIVAPRFVQSLFFETISSHQSLTTSYYPFLTPNVLFTDPLQHIKIFVRMNKADKFATIVGEDIQTATCLSTLYRNVAQTLYNEGIQFIELINDAADSAAIEVALQAGFIPCCYFPALKKHGSMRRDYVVQAKSYERDTESSRTLKSSFNIFKDIFEQVSHGTILEDLDHES